MTRSLSLGVGILLLGAAIAYPVVRRDTLNTFPTGHLVPSLVVTGETEFDGPTNLGTGTVTSTELLDGTIVNADVNASAAIAYSKLTLTNSVAAGDIVNPVRSIPLPIWGWVPCALETGGIWDASGADAEPDLTNTPAGAVAITYDDTGGSIDTGTICTSFTVPADYASGGAFRARLTQDAATTNIETFSCAISVDGAALGAANAGNNVSQAGVQTVTSTPAGTWAAGASIGVACSQGNASADDVVNFLSIEAFYTATQ